MPIDIFKEAEKDIINIKKILDYFIQDIYQNRGFKIFIKNNNKPCVLIDKNNPNSNFLVKDKKYFTENITWYIKELIHKINIFFLAVEFETNKTDNTTSNIIYLNLENTGKIGNFGRQKQRGKLQYFKKDNNDSDNVKKSSYDNIKKMIRELLAEYAIVFSSPLKNMSLTDFLYDQYNSDLINIASPSPQPGKSSVDYIDITTPPSPQPGTSSGERHGFDPNYDASEKLAKELQEQREVLNFEGLTPNNYIDYQKNTNDFTEMERLTPLLQSFSPFSNYQQLSEYTEITQNIEYDYTLKTTYDANDISIQQEEIISSDSEVSSEDELLVFRDNNKKIKFAKCNDKAWEEIGVKYVIKTKNNGLQPEYNSSKCEEILQKWLLIEKKKRKTKKSATDRELIDLQIVKIKKKLEKRYIRFMARSMNNSQKEIINILKNTPSLNEESILDKMVLSNKIRKIKLTNKDNTPESSDTESDSDIKKSFYHAKNKSNNWKDDQNDGFGGNSTLNYHAFM